MEKCLLIKKVILRLPIIDLYFLLILKSFLYSNMQDILDCKFSFYSAGFDMLGLSAMPNSRSASMKYLFIYSEKLTRNRTTLHQDSIITTASWVEAHSTSHRQASTNSQNILAINSVQPIPRSASIMMHSTSDLVIFLHQKEVPRVLNIKKKV